MNEYAVKKALAKREGQQNNAAPAQSVNGIPNSVLTDVFSGKRRATNEMMGHREELAPSIAAKMSQAFGMDFSAVKVYRSDAMAGTEMHGMAQGDKVVLSSDVDLNTQAGQATLGHELSHIRAQSMGMGSGRGLLNDASLEHQADSEGMLAARGMNISGESMGMSMGLGMAGVEGLSPVGAGLGATAAAPMQASKKDKKTAETVSTQTDTTEDAEDENEDEQSQVEKKEEEPQYLLSSNEAPKSVATPEPGPTPEPAPAQETVSTQAPIAAPETQPEIKRAVEWEKYSDKELWDYYLQESSRAERSKDLVYSDFQLFMDLSPEATNKKAYWGEMNWWNKEYEKAAEKMRKKNPKSLGVKKSAKLTRFKELLAARDDGTSGKHYSTTLKKYDPSY